MSLSLLRGGADTWCIEEDRFIPSMAAGRESVFTIGNGYLSTRGSFEERVAGETRATFIQGLFVTPPGELPLLGAAPDWTEVAMTLDGVPFGAAEQCGGYRRLLDMRRGLLQRELLWNGLDQAVVRIRFRRLVSMASRHLAALEVTLTALTRPVDLWFETGLDTSVPSPTIPAWNPIHWRHRGRNRLSLEAESIDGARRLWADTTLVGREDCELIRDPRHHRFACRARLAIGQPETFTKFTTYRSSRDQNSSDDLPEADATFGAVASASARAWERRWRAAAVEIDGDPEAERALRFAAFQVIGASPPRDRGAAVGAKLGSGFGYRHHVFWDSDVFVVPYLTVTLPDLARNHLGYRYRGLEGARRKAKSYGREGAFYAWEAADTGDEVTPEWTSPVFGPPSRIWTGEIEEHITADVAYAAMHYWQWTGDDEFMRREGVEMIVEGARYWASRIEVADGTGHIRGVIGPDEYHSHVDDSFFTNLLASWHLRTAADLAPRFQSSLVTASEARSWRQLARQLTLLQRRDGVWEQHDGFFELEPVDLARFSPRQHSMHRILGEERAERSRVIKQADVVMAMALLPQAVGSKSRRRRNWDYYLPICDHGSSLSMAVHARVAADLGLDDEAYRMFRGALAIDLEDAMGNGADGLHAATQGGILQAFLYGFCGLGQEDGQARLRPRLPSHWRGVGFSYVFGGARFETELSGENRAADVRLARNKTKEKRHETK